MGELFGQIINEGCYNQLRTQEQLGYIVFSGVRRSNGAQGFRVIVQSERHPEYLDSRIEAFLGSLEKSLGELEEEEFKKQVEALATKRLERPKKLSVRNGRYWSEILSQHYNFDRDAVEVEVLRGLTKEDVLTFYRTHIADTKTEEPLEAENGLKESKKPRIVTDITAFKSSLPLFPLAQPFVHPDKLFRADP